MLTDYCKEKLPLNQTNWERTLHLPLTRWAVLAPTNANSTDGTKLRAEKDRSVKAGARVPSYDTYVIDTPADLKGITGFRIEVLPAPGRKALRNKEGRFILSEFSVEVRRQGCKSRPVILQNASADLSLAASPVSDAIDGISTNGWSTDDPRHRHLRPIAETGCHGHAVVRRVREIDVKQALRVHIEREVHRAPVSVWPLDGVLDHRRLLFWSNACVARHLLPRVGAGVDDSSKSRGAPVTGASSGP